MRKQVWSTFKLGLLCGLMFLSALSAYSVDKRHIDRLERDNRELRAVNNDWQAAVNVAQNMTPKQVKHMR